MWRALKDGFFLSEFVPNDKPTLVEWLAEKEISDLTLTIPYPYEVKHADEWIAFVEAQTKKLKTPLQWAIRDADGKLVGAIGLSEFVPGEAHKSDLGYWIAKPYWNKGLATSAVKAVCKMAFDEMGLIRVSATVFAHNGASEKVLTKAGFLLEGKMKYHYYKNETLMDGLLYANVIEPE